MPAMDIWQWIFTVFSLILSKKNLMFDWLFSLDETISLIDRQYHLTIKGFDNFIFAQPFHHG